MCKKWTEEEISILRNNPDMSVRKLCDLIPFHPYESVKRKRLSIGMPRRCNQWTKEEWEILNKHGQYLSSKELVGYLPNHTFISIEKELKKLGIHKTSEIISEIISRTYKDRVEKGLVRHNYKLDHSFTIDDLDNTTYQVLIGSMLGDGCVKFSNERSKYAIFAEDHGIEQKDYLIWKHGKLNIFKPSKVSCLETKPDLCTPSHPIFSSIRKDFYDENIGEKKFIHTKYMQRLDELGLLIWFLDDGNRSGRKIEITSILFIDKDIKSIVDHINEKLGLSLYIRVRKKLSHGKTVKHICFNTKDRDKIMPIWIDLFKNLLMPECMRYKIYKVCPVCDEDLLLNNSFCEKCQWEWEWYEDSYQEGLIYA